MARDFDGSTDRIDYANIWDAAGQAQTIAMWVYPDTINRDQYFFVTHAAGDASITGPGVFWINEDLGTDRFQFTAFTDNTNVFQVAYNIITAGSWQHVLMTWDGSLTAANIKFYKNGVAQGSDLEQDGVGNFIAGGSHSIGGRIYDDLRNFDGRFAGVGWWDRILSAGERNALAKGYSPLFFPSGLKFAPDLVREIRDPVSGKTGTADGTTVVAHPRIIYPSHNIVLPPAAADTETLNVAAVSEVNGVWTDSANIIGQYDVATATIAQDEAGDYSGTAAMEDTNNIPTGIKHFKIIVWNSGNAINNDIYTLQFYDLDSISWINFSSSPLENSETEYVDGQYLTDILAKFDAAADKKAWINAFAIRWDIQEVKGADGVVISTQGVELEIEYTPAAGGPKGPFGHPFYGPFRGPIT